MIQNIINMELKKYLRRGLTYIHRGVPNNIINVCISYLQPSERLKDKKIIITGGGHGLGYSMAKRFISEGAQVLISGRNEEVLKEAAQELGCNYLRLDVQDIKSFPMFIKQAKELMGDLNVLVNNAGVSCHENGILNVSEEQFDAQFDTNLKGSYFLTQTFIAECGKSKKGDIKRVLFISSETGVTVDERPYGLTKAALNSLVQGLAFRFASKGFRFNAVAPGVTASDMTGIKVNDNLYYPNQVTSRYYLPEEIAEIACFLLSDASNILNGQILVCNEGKTINARWK